MQGIRYKRGWFNESYRHSLASRGISTAKYAARKRLYHGTSKRTAKHILKSGLTAGSFISLDPMQAEYFGKDHGDPQVLEVELDDTRLFAFNPFTGDFRKITPEELDDLRDDEYVQYNDWIPPSDIRTYPAMKRRKKKADKWDIPISAEKLPPDRIYPVPPEKVHEILARQDPEHIKGLKGIEFVNPKGEQKEAWAQYVRSRRVIKIFSQPFSNGMIDGQPADEVYAHIVNYVLPHEIGHHRALEVEKITDKHLPMAEARADAHVVGMSPCDRDVRMFLRKTI